MIWSAEGKLSFHLLKIARETLLKTILMGLMTIEIGREIELNYKSRRKDDWWLITNEQSKRVDGKSLRETWLVIEDGGRGVWLAIIDGGILQKVV